MRCGENMMEAERGARGLPGKVWHERLSNHLNGRRRRLPQVMEEVAKHGYSPKQQLEERIHIPGFLNPHWQKQFSSLN